MVVQWETFCAWERVEVEDVDAPWWVEGGGNARCRIRMANEEMPKGRHAARPIEKAMACIKCAI